MKLTQKIFVILVIFACSFQTIQALDAKPSTCSAPELDPACQKQCRELVDKCHKSNRDIFNKGTGSRNRDPLWACIDLNDKCLVKCRK